MLAFIILATLPASLASDLTSFSKTFESSPCFPELLKTVTHWRVNAQGWKKASSASATEPVLMAPTDQIGAWVFVQNTEDRRGLEAVKQSDETRLIASWSPPECKPEFKEIAAKKVTKKDPNFFDDQSLRDLVAVGDRGVIFAYSKGMHLSTEAIADIRAAAKKLNIKLTLVRDPEGDSVPVKDPIADSRKLASTDLYFRGMTLHYPSLIVYSGRKLTSAVYSGRKTESQYLSFIQEHLK